MRPTAVEMRAFGPYAEVQLIDFRQLGAHPLFLITGPTGSGKTTVLDAMCFALFGVATSFDRPADRLRSDHADPATPTQVRFDFELRRKAYRIVRSPKQERPRKRGKGTTSEDAKATLWERSLTAADHEDGSVLATGNVKVTAEVETLLGFEADQFRQVVMIPQGEFRRLLSAKVDDREAILRTLFDTRRYRRVEHELKARHKSIWGRLQKGDVACATLCESAGVEGLEQLGTLIAARDGEIRETRAATNKLEAAAKKATAAFETGRQAAERLAELKDAQAAVDELAKRSHGIATQGATLARAQKAKLLAPTAEHCLQRGRELARANQAQIEAKATLSRVVTERKKADAALAAERARDSQRSEGQKRIGELETHSGKAQKLLRERAQAQAADAALCGASQAEDAAREDASKKTNQAEAARTRCDEARTKAAGVVAARTAADAAAKARTDATRHQAKKATLETARRREQKARKKLVRDEALVSSAGDTVRALRSAWEKGQAAVLARGLKDEQPCPVCGSSEHPAPATTDEEVPEQRALNKAEQTVRDAEASRELSRAEADEETAEVTALRSAVETLGEGLGAESDQPIAALAQREKALSLGWAAAEEAQQVLPRLETASEEAAAALQRANKILATTAAAREKANTVLVAARVREDSVAESLPEALRAAGALSEAIEAAKTEVAALNEAIDLARTQARAAGERLAQAEVRAAEARKQEHTAANRDREAADDLRQAIETAGFEAEEDYREARRDDAEMAVIDQEIRAWDDATARADARRKAALKAAQGNQPPDLARLETAATEASQAHAQSRETLGGLQIDAKSLKDTEAKLARIEKGREADFAEQKIIGRLADTAEGKNGAKISFQRFVLAAFLEDVLRAATHRLRRMSSGRYTLHRATGVQDGRRKGGLDLDVLDAYTGRSRPVGTLSGGEGFEASLALALGLADTVQAQSGGIRLDAIFVDEGFGSLGSDDLDAVIGALEDLQEGGRLVGVISHVSELAERIPARLEISKKRTGSSARFVVP
jgi:exonuclease SbcC